MYIYVAFAAGGQQASSLSYEQGGAAASPPPATQPHTARGLGRGWPTEAIGDYVMKKERLAVDCPLVVLRPGL